MSSFDDLVPSAQKGQFDDLVPSTDAGAFDDLVTEQRRWYSDVPLQIVGGIRDAVQQNSNLGEQVLKSPLAKYSVPGLALRGAERFIESKPERAERAARFRDLPEVPEAETTAGAILRPLAQFGTDFIPLFRIARSMGLANAIRGTGTSTVRSGAAMLAEGEIAGLAADQIAFDPRDERLSNLIQQHPALQNPVTEYLAADPNDSEAEARLKVALEGAGLSALFTPIVHGASLGLRTLRNHVKPTTNAASEAQLGGAAREVNRVSAETAELSGTEAVERRKNLAERKRIEQMTPDEVKRELLTSELTGLPNRRAYQEAAKQPVQVAVDVDSLKWVNDTLGHEAGDELLAQVGRALKDEGLDAFHVSGDEFIVQGAKREDVEAALQRAADRLQQVQVKRGAQAIRPAFSYGVGNSLEQADAALLDAKRMREASGTRAARGEAPPSYEGPALPAVKVRQVDAGTPEELLSREAEQVGTINLNNIQSPDDVKAAIAETARRFSARIDDARRGTINDDQLRALADDLGMTPQKLLQRQRGQAFNPEQALAARGLLVDSAADLVEKSKGAIGGSDEALIAFQNAFARHVAIQEQIAGLTAEAGRSFRQFKLAARKGSKQHQIKEAIEAFGGREDIEQLAEMIGRIEDQATLNTFVRGARKAKTSDMLLEAWINALLSGPQTQMVNVLSNSLVALWTLPEHMLASAIGSVRRGEDRVFPREVVGRAFGFVQGAKDGLRLALKTFLTEQPSDQLSKIETRRHQAIPSVVFRRDAKPIMLGEVPLPFTGPVELGGKQIRIPGRMLQAGDEFFKAIGYRMELNALAMRTGLQQGLEGDELAKHIDQALRNPPPALHRAAMDAARYQTFTQKLGDIGQGIQKIANAHPSMRLVLPFIRTPANIVKFAAERTPFGLLMREVRDNLRAGGVTRDIQLARLTFGSMVGGVVASMAAEGSITGGGPSDPRLRAALRETGWQPYSVKIGDRYYAYNRLEPLGMIFGLSADYAEIAGELDHAEAREVAAMITGSISKNLTSKTWLRGVSELLEAVNDPDRYGDRYVQNFAGTLIPTVVAHTARVNDPVLRQTETVLDKLKSRVPGYSKSLPPRLNMWGEPIQLGGGVGPDMVSPIYTSDEFPDKLAQEVVRLELKIGMPSKLVQDIELTPEEYARYVQLAGKPAKEVLMKAVTAPFYDTLPDAAKRALIVRTIMKTRAEARQQLLATIPRERVLQAKLKAARSP